MSRYITKKTRQTKELAKEILTSIKSNVILLSGDLGSGKTVFVKGLADVLGIKEVVNSPTFVLMKIYDIENPDFQQTGEAASVAEGQEGARSPLIPPYQGGSRDFSIYQKGSMDNFSYQKGKRNSIPSSKEKMDGFSKIKYEEARVWKRLIHVDLYRLDEVSNEDLINLGLREYMDDPESLVVIEWADRIKSKIAGRSINFKVISEQEREIEY